MPIKFQLIQRNTPFHLYIIHEYQLSPDEAAEVEQNLKHWFAPYRNPTSRTWYKIKSSSAKEALITARQRLPSA